MIHVFGIEKMVFFKSSPKNPQTVCKLYSNRYKKGGENLSFFIVVRYILTKCYCLLKKAFRFSDDINMSSSETFFWLGPKEAKGQGYAYDLLRTLPRCARRKPLTLFARATLRPLATRSPLNGQRLCPSASRSDSVGGLVTYKFIS